MAAPQTCMQQVALASKDLVLYLCVSDLLFCHARVVEWGDMQVKVSLRGVVHAVYDDMLGSLLRCLCGDTGTATLQHDNAYIQHSTAQHSTAQHSTAQHSTAQHSTA